MAGRSRLGAFIKLGPLANPSPRARDHYHIVLMGAEDVGKTALVVRFLTRKYLPEYCHGTVTHYERTVVANGKAVGVRLTDTSGKESFTSLKAKGLLEGVDGYIVVYSITDKRSFFKSRELLKLLHEDFVSESRVPMALIGNKDDLAHFRAISTMEGQRVSLAYPRCVFHEVSAAREADNVHAAVHDFLREVMQSKEQRRHLSAFSVLSLRSGGSAGGSRRGSIGNSALGSWWRRSRCSTSQVQNRQDRTFTM
ncbi:ras-related and estrogen-regulated growth inhibitor-like protein [Ornithodoros turicata]|uniref:ras-related and estrogen-regulated growth inhibitor-like protein n=1 Tax=Ornithodoros turicata TaxID=34597 RepID=UPI0031391620